MPTTSSLLPVLVFLASLGPLLSTVQAASFSVVQDFSGSTFFDKWDFFGNYDNLTGGAVVWPDKADTLAQGLAFVNSAGNAVIKVDNTTTVLYPNKRNSTRITTQQAFGVGSIFVADIVHMPYGCSVWPAFWTKGINWPQDGEIDILEGVNLDTQNQMALHTRSGCSHPAPASGAQTGTMGPTDCSQDAGCTVIDTRNNSFGQNFDQNGGGIYAAQFDTSGIFIWFFPRNQIPQSLLSATSTSSIDSLTDWGTPAASYPSSSSCDIPTYFDAQSLVIDIDLCGDFAGASNIYLPQCASQGPQKLCYPDNVIGPGSQYDNAYFEFKYVRVYGNGNSTVIGGTSTTGSAATSSGTASSHSSSDVRNIESLWLVSWMWAVAAVMGMASILY